MIFGWWFKGYKSETEHLKAEGKLFNQAGFIYMEGDVSGVKWHQIISVGQRAACSTCAFCNKVTWCLSINIIQIHSNTNTEEPQQEENTICLKSQVINGSFKHYLLVLI